MKNIQVVRQLQRIDAFMKAAIASTNDIELRAHWAKYICILVAGFLENALAEIYVEYAMRASSGPTANYARSRLITIQNPKADKFVEVARCFQPDWGEQLERFMAENGRKDAIDSIMASRHQIAHGKNSGITYVQISNYLKKSLEVIEFIETQIRP